MAWYADLTPYSYLADSHNTLNIGWLENGHPFPTGEAPLELAERLAILIEHAKTCKTRGLHHCDLCPDSNRNSLEDLKRMSARNHPTGSAEIRAVGADGTRYAAPTLILHYVTAHQYLPPPEFVAAVLRPKLDVEAALRDDTCLVCESPLTRIKDAYRVRIFCEVCGCDYERR